jgi:hypothetical protein
MSSTLSVARLRSGWVSCASEVTRAPTAAARTWRRLGHRECTVFRRRTGLMLVKPQQNGLGRKYPKFLTAASFARPHEPIRALHLLHQPRMRNAEMEAKSCGELERMKKVGEVKRSRLGDHRVIRLQTGQNQTCHPVIWARNTGENAGRGKAGPWAATLSNFRVSLRGVCLDFRGLLLDTPKGPSRVPRRPNVDLTVASSSC